jgi:hypothetical protein
MKFVKLRIFIRLTYLLFQTALLAKRTGVFYKSCSLCQGAVHTKIDSQEDLEGNYNAKFQCKKCGAIGTLHEKWEKQGG